MKPLILSLVALILSLVVVALVFLARRRKPVVRLDARPLLEIARKETVFQPLQQNHDGSVTLQTQSLWIEWQSDPLRLGEMIWIWPRLHDDTKNHDDLLKLVFQNGKSVEGCAHAEAFRAWVRDQLGAIITYREIGQATRNE